MRKIIFIIIALIFILTEAGYSFNLVNSLRVPLSSSNEAGKKRQGLVARGIPGLRRELWVDSPWITDDEQSDFLVQAIIYVEKIGGHIRGRFIDSLEKVRLWMEGREDEIQAEVRDEDVNIYYTPDAWQNKRLLRDINKANLSNKAKLILAKYILIQRKNVMPHISALSLKDLERISDIMNGLIELERIKAFPSLIKLFQGDIAKIKRRIESFSNEAQIKKYIAIIKGKLQFFDEEVATIRDDIKDYLEKGDYKSIFDPLYSARIGVLIAMAKDGFPFSETMLEQLKELKRTLEVESLERHIAAQPEWSDAVKMRANVVDLVERLTRVGNIYLYSVTTPAGILAANLDKSLVSQAL